jgi:hypothetical protein
MPVYDYVYKDLSKAFLILPSDKLNNNKMGKILLNLIRCFDREVGKLLRWNI